ncbi:MAG: hypothetical protein J6T94_02785 [Bacteroidaceae bacterium]|nr:hypothetical protein [Bacteroidaceae bacterium]
MKTLSKLFFALRYKQAVRKADRFAHITHRKHMVIVINRKLHVVAKKDIKQLIAQHRFRKGTTIHDIEQHALYITL